jgi:serine/threonine protein phosphatase PrpC
MFIAIEFQNTRPYMEDRYAVGTFGKNKTNTLYAVFDGHGGSDVAEMCKQNVIHVLNQCMSLSLDMSTCLRNTFHILDNLAKSMDTNDIGSTAVVCVLTPDRLWFANAGDSMAMICYKEGHSEMMSLEHKVENEKKRIEASGGMVTYWDGTARVNGILNVSRSIGDHTLKNHVISDPFIRSINTHNLKYEFIIVASDGIWDVFDVNTLTAEFKRLLVIKNEMYDDKKKAVSEVLVDIISLARGRNSFDNITILYIDQYNT